jgi:DNA-binding SARP family transcriptional activator
VRVAVAQRLCFLLLHAGEMLERDYVAEQLWPMRPRAKARRCLSTALWRLRAILENQAPPARDCLLTERDSLMFDKDSPYWFDVEAFDQQASFGLAGPIPCTESHQQALEEALSLSGCSSRLSLLDRSCLSCLSTFAPWYVHPNLL